jgi:non-ribosomal peptide synthetase component F
VREVCLGAYAHQDVPFEKLVEELQPERDLSRNPLFQVTLELFNAPNSDDVPPIATLGSLEIDQGTAVFDVTLHLLESPEGLSGQFEYSTDLFDAATIARLAEHFQTLLEGIVTNPHQRISQLPLLTESEQRQLLVEWNATQADYPADAAIHQLFQLQAERTPDVVAVVFDGAQLTYGELSRRANQVARYLRSHGVGPDVLVGLCMERGVEMVVGM